MDSCEEFLYSDGTTVEICGEARLDYRDGSYYFRPYDVTRDIGSRQALMRGTSYWFEDFPNLDLDIMTEGVP